ncbi:MAG TPA: hypothetical protein VF297_12475 [Pyrinomonadaceae bacterium]
MMRNNLWSCVNDGRALWRMCVVALLLSAALAHGVNANAVAPQAEEQTNFNLEEPVARPATIPPDVLRGLGQDEKVLTCLTSGGGNATVEIPAAWFAASEVHLNGDKLPDLVVKPQNACLNGANIGPFWVFRNTGRGYALVLRADTLGLEVLRTRTRGYRNIRLSSATARRVQTSLLKFDGKTYRAARR